MQAQRLRMDASASNAAYDNLLDIISYFALNAALTGMDSSNRGGKGRKGIISRGSHGLLCSVSKKIMSAYQMN